MGSCEFLAIVQIEFPSRWLKPEERVEIEDLLRAEEGVDHLAIESSEITFFCWKHEKIDYHFLDEIRDKLNRWEFLKFTITARAYQKTGEPYHYSRGDELNGPP